MQALLPILSRSTAVSSRTGPGLHVDRSQAVFQSLTGAAWTNASIDSIIAPALRKAEAAVQAVAAADGQDVAHAAVYVNYAMFGTPLEETYGRNMPRLRKIRAVIDPKDVMGLAGGFKF